MTLQAASLDWAINFVLRHSDGDLFPKVLEMEGLAAEKEHFTAQIAGKDLAAFPAGTCRRFIVPKDEYSYRQATQLDPQDSILLTALIYEYGEGIERRRRPKTQVFSYRFNPTIDEGLYGGKSAWNNFWSLAAQKSHAAGCVLYCDVADFYNQIYHHSVENQLIESGFPNQGIKWLVALLESTTAGVSRGVPVGPHAIHLVAEATLVPIDNSLSAGGLRFLRYADDIVVFCKSADDAKRALARIATVLDKQQRLTLQRHKTRIFLPNNFRNLCAEMIEDRPISPTEAGLLKLIRKYSGGNPYKTISYNEIAENDWNSISEPVVREIIEDYIAREPVDYIRLRWFYRRLSQIGHPGAIDVSLQHIDRLGPCLANICSYLSSVQTLPPKAWKKLGGQLLKILRMPEVRENEYFRLSLLSLFARNGATNHFAKLLQLYQGGDPFARREIVLAAQANAAQDWLRELKEDFPGMDPWQQSAYIYSIAGLPKDEKKYFVNRWSPERPILKTLKKWAKRI